MSIENMTSAELRAAYKAKRAEEMGARKRKAAPHALLDSICVEHKLCSDMALGLFLGLERPHVSKLRHRKIPVSGDVIIAIHEKTGMPIARIKELAA
jgi:hypothetical protein